MNNVLNESQIKTSLSAVYNIEDKLAAIKKELLEVEKPHKEYLNEKLESIYWDVIVLRNISKIKEEESDD